MYIANTHKKSCLIISLEHKLIIKFPNKILEETFTEDYFYIKAI